MPISVYTKQVLFGGINFPYLTPGELLSIGEGGDLITVPQQTTQYQEYLYQSPVSSISITHNWNINPFVVILSLDGVQLLEGVVTYPSSNSVNINLLPASPCKVILYGGNTSNYTPTSVPNSINSVFGRIGVITAQSGDYTATMVGADPTGTASSLITTHYALKGLGSHIPSTGIADTHVSSTAAIAWSKISKSGALPSDLGALASSNNLSDLANPSTARTNLGLGSASTLASSAVLQSSNNLSDLANAGTARSNIGASTASWNANKLQGNDISSTAPTNAQSLTWNSSTSNWVPTLLSDTHISPSASISWSKLNKSGALPSDVGALALSSNLSDLPDKAAARSNIGAATAAWNADKLQGNEVSTTAPTDAQALIWNASTSKWTPGNVATSSPLSTTLTGLSPSAQTVTSSHTLIQGISYLQGQLNNITFTAGYFNGGNSTSVDSTIGLLSNYSFSFLTNNLRRFTIKPNGSCFIWSGNPSDSYALSTSWMPPASLTIGSIGQSMGLAGAEQTNNTAGLLLETLNDFYIKVHSYTSGVFEFLSFKKNSGQYRMTFGNQTSGSVPQMLFKTGHYFEFSNVSNYNTDTFSGSNLPPIYSDTNRSSIYIRGRHPSLILQPDNFDNQNHGPVIQFTALDADNSTQQSWKFGTPSRTARFIDLGWFSSSGDVNPHHGLRGSNGPTGLSIVAPGKSQNNTLGNNYGFGFNAVLEPQYTVHVNGSIGVGVYNSQVLTLYTDPNGRPSLNTPSDWDISIKRNSVEQLRFQSTGIQTYTSLSVTGTLASTTGLNVNGTQYINSSRPSISTLPSNATLTQVIDKLNEIINAFNGASGYHRLFT